VQLQLKERKKERKALPILQLNFISFNILPVNIKHGNSSTLVQKYLLKKITSANLKD
jgi:hypothetical protein